jgi:hypothetical protein
MCPEPQGLGLADERGPLIEACDEGVGRCEFHLDVVYLPAVRIVEPTIIPVVGATRSQVPNDGQPARFALAQRRIAIPRVAFELSLSITRGLQPANPAAQQAVALEDLHCSLSIDEPDTFRSLCRRRVCMRNAGHGGSEQENQTFEFHGGLALTGIATSPTRSQRNLHVFRCDDTSQHALTCERTTTRQSVNPSRAIN